MNLQTLILIVLQVSMFLSVFAIGLKASVQDATYFFRRPGELVRALLAMNVLMPVFAVLLISLFDFNPAVKIAVVALSVSPIPPLLPSKMVKEGGTNSYAIGLLIAISLLAIILVPVAIEVVEWVRNVPLQITMASIAKVVFITVLLPTCLGIAVHACAPYLATRLAKPITLISIIALLACMVAIWIAAGPAMWTLIGNGTVIALAAFVLFGLTIGYLLGGPRPENRTSLALATASRHPGIALALAQANFPEQKLAAAAVLLYLLVNAVVSIPYFSWIKRRKPVIENQVKEGMTEVKLTESL
jgi:BASS family bile acid:Na+ symporter